MDNAPHRVLQVVALMNRGGTETMLMNHYRALDRSKVQFDFLLHGDEKGAYDDEILALGGRIFRAPKIRPWSYLKYFNWLDNFFREHAKEFIAVHGHIQENTGFALKYAHKYGINNRLATGHAAPKNIDYKFIFREFARVFLLKHVTQPLACGNEAGVHLFKGRKFDIVHNAIPIDLFLYNDTVRQKIREELNISPDNFVIGHVGRFDNAKNQGFLVSILEKLIKSDPNALLVLVGKGSTFDIVKNKVEQLGLSNNVKMLGIRSDVNEILQAFDVFVMPSVFEGLPVSVIEAQTAGLPCILSDTIDASTDITGNVRFLSLDEPVEKWAETIASFRNFERTDMAQAIKDAGYEINNNIELLLNYYGV